MSDLLRDRVMVAVGHQYLIEREIGRGGMAVVYLATDIRLNRRVAIKVLPPELAFNDDVRARFIREAQTAAQLSHPNIVPIYAVDEREGIVYIVMAFVDGESVGSHLAREVRWSIDRVVRTLREVADALAYAHSHGVVHRDIKPDNILIERASGRAMVTDFGIARAAAGETRLTMTGVAVGTPAYMSPEQALGERELDGRSDIYSLGVVGYQMLAGETPFKAANTPAMLVKHVSERPRPIREMRGDIPAYLAVVVDRALAKRPDDRWADAAELRDAIDQAAPAKAFKSMGAEKGGIVIGASIGADRHRRDALLPDVLPMHQDMPAPPPGMSRRELKRWHRTQRRLILRDHGMMHADSYDDLPLERRVVAFRRSMVSFLVFTPVLFVINVSTKGPPWFFIPAAFMLIDSLRKLGSIWSDGVGPIDAFKKGIRARLRRADAAAAAPVGAARDQHPFPVALAPVDLATSLAPADVLAGSHGESIRRAAADRAAIRDIVNGLRPVEREMIPDVGPNADALTERVASIAITLHQLDADVAGSSLNALDDRIAAVAKEPEGRDRERRVSLLQRQRASLQDILERRLVLASQLERVSLTLQNLKFDLLKLRSSGLASAIEDVTSATQEAQALSREIGTVLEATNDLRRL